MQKGIYSEHKINKKNSTDKFSGIKKPTPFSYNWPDSSVFMRCQKLVHVIFFLSKKKPIDV